MLIDSLFEGRDLSGTALALKYTLTTTKFIGALQCLDLHMKLVYLMMSDL